MTLCRRLKQQLCGLLRPPKRYLVLLVAAVVTAAVIWLLIFLSLEPRITKQTVSDRTPDGFTLTLNLQSGHKIGAVTLTTWSLLNGRDDEVQTNAIIKGRRATAVVQTPVHGNHQTDIAVYDTDGGLLFTDTAGIINVPGILRDGEPASTRMGIDVSVWQGDINWQAVKATGIDFAILRGGYGIDHPDSDDELFEQNAAACEQQGIPYGMYLFCYARNADEARQEALHALRLAEGRTLSLPIFLDMEDSAFQGELTNAAYAAIAKAFCETIEQAGYRAGIYSYLGWWENKLTDPCFDNWERWVAQYNDICEYTGDYTCWQYTAEGHLDGIDTVVDFNEWYDED